MFGFGKNNAAIDTFAVELCADLHKRFPPAKESLLGGDKKKVGLKLGNAFTDLQRKAATFQMEQKLGVYGKARLLRSIRDELVRLQYGESMIEGITDLLVNAPAKNASP